jgi:hypothetical protein
MLRARLVVLEEALALWVKFPLLEASLCSPSRYTRGYEGMLPRPPPLVYHHRSMHAARLYHPC